MRESSLKDFDDSKLFESDYPSLAEECLESRLEHNGLPRPTPTDFWLSPREKVGREIFRTFVQKTFFLIETAKSWVERR